MFKKKIALSIERQRDMRDQTIRLRNESAEYLQNGYAKTAKILEKRANTIAKILKRGYMYQNEIN
ncbi:MAG: hypothetical protein ACJ71H_05000 [Nitrososphaeraceae archaeon]